MTIQIHPLCFTITADAKIQTLPTGALETGIFVVVADDSALLYPLVLIADADGLGRANYGEPLLSHLPAVVQAIHNAVYPRSPTQSRSYHEAFYYVIGADGNFSSYDTIARRTCETNHPTYPKTTACLVTQHPYLGLAALRALEQLCFEAT